MPSRGKHGQLWKLRPASEREIRSRFRSDCRRVAELTDGAIDLMQLVEFVHSDQFRIGMAFWGFDGTNGINGGQSCFGIPLAAIPKCCTTFKQMAQAARNAVIVAGGSVGGMMHAGLHAANVRKGWQTSEIHYANLEPWQEWEAELQCAGHDVLASFDPTLWGGPEDDGLTLGSTIAERRNYFIRHLQGTLRALIEFSRRRAEYLIDPIPVRSNIWLSDASKRPPVDGAAIKRTIMRVLAEVLDGIDWRGKVDASIEGKAPPTQQSAWMGVTNADAVLIACQLGLRLCADDGHGYPTEPMCHYLASAMAAGLELAAHLTYNPSGADDDLTLGTTGHVREFILQASRLHPERRDHVIHSKTLYQQRCDALSNINIGCDMFETGIPPEAAMVQGVMSTRMNAIMALLAPDDIAMNALFTGKPEDRMMAIFGNDHLPNIVDPTNCLAWYRLQQGQDPDWIKCIMRRYKARVA